MVSQKRLLALGAPLVFVVRLAMTVLWTDDVKARADAKADAKESRTESRTDAETESTEFASEIEAESSVEWVTSLWLDVKPAADKSDAKKRPVLEQVTALGSDIFNEDPLAGCSKRGGWRLHVAVGQRNEQIEMMGFIVFRIKPERNALIIAQLAVPEEHRRMGFGSLLLKTLIAEAKRLPEIHSIGLSSLPGSIKFYKRHGFKLMHRLPDSEAKAEGQVYMELKTPSKKKK